MDPARNAVGSGSTALRCLYATIKNHWPGATRTSQPDRKEIRKGRFECIDRCKAEKGNDH